MENKLELVIELIADDEGEIRAIDEIDKHNLHPVYCPFQNWREKNKDYECSNSGIDNCLNNLKNKSTKYIDCSKYQKLKRKYLTNLNKLKGGKKNKNE